MAIVRRGPPALRRSPTALGWPAAPPVRPSPRLDARPHAADTPTVGRRPQRERAGPGDVSPGGCGSLIAAEGPAPRPGPRGRWAAAAAAAAAFALSALPAASTGAFHARALRAIDGDSLLVEPSTGKPREIRLEGVDCPEVGQPFADAASAFADAFVKGRELEVEGSVADEHGRLVARVRAAGRDLSLALVREGLAWHFKRYSKDAALAEAENAARAARRGLWSDPSPVAPWDFRASQRTAGADRKARAPANGGSYVGNVRSLLFHTATCKNASCANCVKRFASREAALAAGYTPARCCRP